MLQFVQTIWLWALGALAVPIIIHLWNVKQGKTLKVGSIAFLTESARSHSKSLKLSELPLLLLRCLLLTILVWLLTKPFWEKQIDIAKEKGWILIDKCEVKQAYATFKPQIDSLLKAGYNFRYFNDSFPEQKFGQALQNEYGPMKQYNRNYWSLLRELNQKVPSKLPLFLYTSNSVQRFSGSIPNVSLNLKWQTYPSKDSASTWLEKAYEISSDSIRVVKGNSNRTGTFYSHQNISFQTSNNQYDINIEDGKTVVTLKDSLSRNYNNTIEVDTTTLVVCIYIHKYDADANYLRAAVDAVKEFSKHKMKVTVTSNPAAIPNCSWLFWLSDKLVPAALVQGNVFVYDNGKPVKGHSNIITTNEVALGTDATVELSQNINRSNAALGEAVWKDGYGNALLSKEIGRANIYRFYSRLNPQWNDLPWNGRFPEIIYELMFAQANNASDQSFADKRMIDNQQLQPRPSKASIIKQELLRRTDLTKVFWIIAFVLFLAERIFSYRSKTKDANG
jgi:hypothetical protein